MIEIETPATGSALFIGHESQNQSAVIRDIAGQHLAKGGSIVALVDMPSERRAIEAAFSDWLRAHDLDRVEALPRIVVLANYRTYKTADDLHVAIMQAMRRVEGQPLVLIDLGRDTRRTLPGVHVLSVAEELALLMDCAVLIAGHYGPEGTPAQDAVTYRADAVWTCKAGSNLGLELRRVKPSPELAIKAKGKVMAFGQIDFSNVPEEGFANV